MAVAKRVSPPPILLPSGPFNYTRRRCGLETSKSSCGQACRRRSGLVTNNGQGVQSLQLIDTDKNTVVQTLSFASPESLYVGLAWSPDGRKLVVAEQLGNAVTDTATTQMTTVAVGHRPVWVTLSKDGRTAYVSN